MKRQARHISPIRDSHLRSHGTTGPRGETTAAAAADACPRCRGWFMCPTRRAPDGPPPVARAFAEPQAHGPPPGR